MREGPILMKREMVLATLADRKTNTRRVMQPQPRVVKVVSGMRNTGSDVMWAPQMRNPLYNLNVAKYRDALCSYGKPGDRLYVRENFAYVPHPTASSRCRIMPDGRGITWQADWSGNPSGYKWKPSIHMPRQGSRIMLEITRVRVEQLQEISETEAIAEGIEATHNEPGERIFWRNYLFETAHPRRGVEIVPERHRIRSFLNPIDSFRTLWDSINAAPSPVKGGDGQISHYVSYPWGDLNETRSHRGKPWHVIGNPWVWALEFRRLESEVRNG